MKQILIIGAAGFVGPYLIEHLQTTFDCQIIVTKLPNEKFSFSGIRVEDLDITNPIAIIQLLREIKPDWIINLAAQNSIGYTWENPGLAVEVNVKGSINILDAAKQLDYQPKILLVGSGEEYGGSNLFIPLSETRTLHPSNIYGATKACQNMMAAIYARAYKMHVVMARSFNYIGPRQSTLFVVSDFAQQIAKIEKGFQAPQILVGNLESRRDFVDVRDVVCAYSMLLEKGNAGEIYNVGSGNDIQIKTILDKLLAMSEKNIVVRISPSKIRPVDVPIVKADIKKISETIGWRPKISLERSLQDVLEYWRNVI